jgi:uncharacterized protein
MKAKLIQDGPERTFAVIFSSGDEFLAGIKEFASQHNLRASHFTAVGAFSDVTLGYFQRDRKSYKKQKFSEQFEVLALVGDITLEGDGHMVHPHVVLGRADFTTLGGHIMEAHVWPTLELIVVETPGSLQRHHDEESGLALIGV